jgi:hypothetical protein
VSGAGFVLRVKTLSRKTGGANIISRAAKHNRRAIPAEVAASTSINPARSHLNETLAGPDTADGVAALAKQMMSDAGIVVLRKNAVLGIELVFSLPPNHPLDDRAFFADCTNWVGGYFGGFQNVISSDIHRDEAAPHCHVLVLPLVGGVLSASKLLGNRERIAAMHAEFYKSVASRYGLAKPAASLSGAAKAAGVTAVLKRLREANDGAMGSLAWAAIRESIERHPDPFLLELGIDLADVTTRVEKPKKQGKTFEQIMTGKGRATAEDKKPYRGLQAPKEVKPYRELAPEIQQTLSCVGHSRKARLAEPPELPKEARAAEEPRPSEVVRVRDRQQDAALWDSDTGEFLAAPAKPARPARAGAERWVKAALSARGSTGPGHKVRQ